MDNRRIIIKAMNGNEIALLDQAVEECAELIQALLKVKRFIEGVNPPAETDGAIITQEMIKEITDVCLTSDIVMNVIGKPFENTELFERVWIEKEEHWAKRIRENVTEEN